MVRAKDNLYLTSTPFPRNPIAADDTRPKASGSEGMHSAMQDVGCWLYQYEYLPGAIAGVCASCATSPLGIPMKRKLFESLDLSHTRLARNKDKEISGS